MPAGRDPVSVVIPVWGAYAGRWLDEALASLRAQDVPVEIVLVDNAGDLPLDRPGVTVVRSEERLALGAARNLGLRAVHTPLVVFWDADDTMPGGTLERLVAEIDRDPALAVSGASIVDAATGERHHWPRRWPLRLGGAGRVFAVLNAVSSVYGVIGSVLRTEQVRQAPFPETDGGDDWVLAVSLAFRGRVAVHPEPGRVYGRHAGSVSSTWVDGDAVRHARLVRERLRQDPLVPASVRRLVPAIWLAQQGVLRVLRPLGRRTPRRRREVSRAGR